MGGTLSTFHKRWAGDASKSRSTARDAYGKRLIPHVIDYIASEAPLKECFQIPCSSSPDDGWRSVNYRQFADAINRCCHQVVSQLGKPESGTYPTVAYIGPNDPVYLVMLLAAVKTGYKVLFISPRNSEEGQLDLFDKTDCHILAIPASHHSIAQPWLRKRNMTIMQVASLDTVFPKSSGHWNVDEVEHYPFDRTFEEAEWTPLCVLHTSGSTGIPKHIVIRQGMVAILDAFHDLEEWQGMNVWMREWTKRASRVYMTMPLFHAAGLYTSIMAIVYWDISVAFGPASRPVSADLVAESLAKLEVQGAVLPPSVLEDMSQDETGIRVLSRLNFVAFGGSSLSRESGDRLVKHGVYLSNVIASTECCVMPIYCDKNPLLWRYFVFRFGEGSCRWLKQDGDDNIYEQIIVRQGKAPGLQPHFYTFPDQSEISTKDLYMPHPELPDHWTYHGRVDDIIVLSNGEKLNPLSIEAIVGRNPLVKGALVVGSGRFQPGLIIEPAVFPANERDMVGLVESVWPTVLEANNGTVAHGRITKDLVTVSKEAKPFFRAGKGTIQRARTVALYEAEVNDLYKTALRASATAEPVAGAPVLDLCHEESLAASIINLFHHHIDVTALKPNDDFFASGIDSLQVISAARLLNAGLRANDYVYEGRALHPRAIYNNPSPRLLAQHILMTYKSSAGDGDDNQQATQSTISALLERYTRNLFRGKPGRLNPLNQGQTVVLTGSTGTLGTHLLDAMVHSPNVRKVICLNRAADGGASRHLQDMSGREDDSVAALYSNKVEFWHADLTRSDFGLPAAEHARLVRDTDRVILNAWPVNFNMAVGSFEPHICGVRHFADFAARAEKRVAIIFISSVSAVHNWTTMTGASEPVPEARLDDLSLAGGEAGYGASKLLGGLILDEAAAQGDFPYAVVRVGQIAGRESKDTRGTGRGWNRNEWFPSIVASSLYLGAFPSDLGSQERVDWTPVERIAGLVLEVGGITQAVDLGSISGYYHGANPKATTWSQIAKAVREFYGEERLPEMIPFSEWVSRLEMSEHDSNGHVSETPIDRNPGIKLVDTYQGIVKAGQSGQAPVVLAMERTMAQSPTMRRSQAITSDLVKQWCKQWNL